MEIVRISDFSRWLSFDFDKREFSINGDNLLTQAKDIQGNIYVPITVVDEYGAQSTYYQIVNVGKADSDSTDYAGKV